MRPLIFFPCLQKLDKGQYLLKIILWQIIQFFVDKFSQFFHEWSR